MKASELYTTLTDVLGGLAISQSLFYRLLNLAKDTVEAKRPWTILIKIDTSLTVGSSNTWQTVFNLPSTAGSAFRRFAPKPRKKIVLYSSSDDSIHGLTEVRFDERLDYKDTFGYFYVDYAANQFYITGTIDKTYTIHICYLYRTKPFSSTDDTIEWPLPEDYHLILVYQVAAMYRGGTDWDDVNARMAPEDRSIARGIWDAMTTWDTELQLSAVNQ